MQPLFKGDKAPIIAEEILKHRDDSPYGYSCDATFQALKEKGVRQVSKQLISYVAQRLRKNDWKLYRDGDEKMEKPSSGKDKKDTGGTKTTGSQSQEGELYRLSGLFPSLKFIIGQRTEVINPEDIHVVYDIYLDAKQNYGWPYDFSSLIRCSGRLFGLMLKLTQGGDNVRLVAETAGAGAVHAGKINEGRND